MSRNDAKKSRRPKADRDNRALRRKRTRHTLMEELERRDLMTGDVVQPDENGFFYPPIGNSTAFFRSDLPAEEYRRRSEAQFGNVQGNRNRFTDPPAGESGGAFTTNEVEPNNNFFLGQTLPLGTAPGQSMAVNVNGTLQNGIPSLDEDYFAVDLRAGDIIDARVTGNIFATFDLSLNDANGNNIISRNNAVGPGAFPDSSPLFTDGNATFSYVIPRDGRYFVRVSDGFGSYSLNLRAFRSTFEQEAIGTRQIVFVDFDGATVNQGIFIPGFSGTARLSPLSAFLPGFNIQPEDEDLLIDAILAGIEENFQGTLPQNAENGFFSSTGVPGQFDIEIRNSRDHADPFGLPNVSRLIIGGSAAEFGIPTVGIAQSIDVGNFDREETAVVLPQAFIDDPVALIPRAGDVTLIDALGVSIGAVASHELGHYFGAWHQDPFSPIPSLMDQGGTQPLGIQTLQPGADGIFGTPDDGDLDFNTDVFALEGNFGVNDTAAFVAFGLSTGTVGGTINGTIFEDLNRSGTQDFGEGILAGVEVFADINENGTRDLGEPRAISNENGRYELRVAAGSFQIRATTLDGFVNTAPVSGVRNVTVAVNQTVTANFGQQRPDPNVTGFKFNDLDGDGIRDADEPGIEGIFIYVDLDGDDRIDIGEPAAVTQADGSYTITAPTSGTFAIREVLEAGFIQTFPVGGEHIVDFSSSDNVVGLDFGNQFAFDFGDAPEQYPVTTANGGASAGFLPGFSLGENFDIDVDGQPSPAADGDNVNGLADTNGDIVDDEDGVTFIRPIVTGDTNNSVSINVQNTSASTAFVSGWIDFNQDGDWDDPGEQIITDAVLADGVNTVNFTAPAAGLVGTTFARFRLSATPGVGPTGQTDAGEVEDYQVIVNDTLNIATDDTFTVPRNSVASPLDVIANDFRTAGDDLTIVNITQGNQNGTVSVTAGGGSIVYTPSSNFVGTETFTYTVQNSNGDLSTAEVVVNVEFALDSPVAVDDSFDVPTNTIGFPLNVLANDLEGQDGALQIVSVSTPTNGGEAVISSGTQSIRYTPARNFGGTEQFTYVAEDAGGNQTTATVTVHTLTGDRDDDLVGISFRVVDEFGTEASAVNQGDNFFVEVFVDDLRTSSAPGAPFVASPGVFSAYFDLLYSGSLAGPTLAADGVSFDDSVRISPFLNGQTGTGDLPGLVDDFGAFSNLQTPPNSPDPVLFARIPFEARAPGIVEFAGDPSEGLGDDVLLFDTISNVIPVDQIRFGRANVEIVGDGVEFPFAVDDNIRDIAPGSMDVPINVLANDTFGSTGNVEIITTSQPGFGSVFIDERGTTDTLDDLIRYSPAIGFQGSDQFTYTINDDRGFSSTATVTVTVGDDAALDDLIELRLEVTDLNGNPIDEIATGEEFLLNGFVRDTRTAAATPGVFAAYQDILFSSDLVSTSNDDATAFGFDVTFDTGLLNRGQYQNVLSGDDRIPGILNEIGSVQNGNDPIGSGEFLQFSVTLTANQVGEATFIGDPADLTPIHDSLLFDPVDPVPFDQISYGFDSITIVAGSGGSGGGGGGSFTNFNNFFDVNDDGIVSPIDALIVISDLNRNGSRDLNGGEGEDAPNREPPFIDVNNDERVSPIDALMVINFLNRNGIGGEGEAGPLLVGPNGEDIEQTDLAATFDSISPSITARDTGYEYGPVQPIASRSVEDSIAAYLADVDDSDEDVDALIGELAEDVLNQWT